MALLIVAMMAFDKKAMTLGNSIATLSALSSYISRIRKQPPCQISLNK